MPYADLELARLLYDRQRATPELWRMFLALIVELERLRAEPDRTPLKWPA
jgi:hypothetical protein